MLSTIKDLSLPNPKRYCKYKKKYKHSFVYKRILKSNTIFIYIGYYSVDTNRHTSMFYIKRTNINKIIRYVVYNKLTREFNNSFYSLREAKRFVIANIRDTIRYANIKFME